MIGRLNGLRQQHKFVDAKIEALTRRLIVIDKIALRPLRARLHLQCSTDWVLRVAGLLVVYILQKKQKQTEKKKKNDFFSRKGSKTPTRSF